MGGDTHKQHCPPILWCRKVWEAIHINSIAHQYADALIVFAYSTQKINALHITTLVISTQLNSFCENNWHSKRLQKHFN